MSGSVEHEIATHAAMSSDITFPTGKTTRGKLLICSAARNRARRRIDNGKFPSKPKRGKYKQTCTGSQSTKTNKYIYT